MADPAKLLKRGPAIRDVNGLFRISEMAEGALVEGLDGLGVDDPPPDGAGPSRVFESQQTDPRSQRLGGSLITTDGLEQKADIRPGRQTPGHRFIGSCVVVDTLPDDLTVVEDDGRTVVEDVGGLVDGRVTGAVAFFCSACPSRRLMQHLPPLEHTAFGSM